MNIGNKLQLPEVAAYTFCWGTEHVAYSLRAMLIGMDQVRFKRAALITDSSKTDLKKFSKTIDDNNIEVYDMNVDLNNNLLNDDSNREGFRDSFLVNVKKYMTDDYCLNFQHDSTIIDPSKWRNDFLRYDYIGAPWPMSIIQSSDMVAGRIPTDNIPTQVGNGGFSLRSRKFVENSVGLPNYHKNEDLNICIFNHQLLKDNGIKLAPASLAGEFSSEHPVPNIGKTFDRTLPYTYNSFGFHGEFNDGGMNFIRSYQLNKTINKG
jgi:hypothetical protein